MKLEFKHIEIYLSKGVTCHCMGEHEDDEDIESKPKVFAIRGALTNAKNEFKIVVENGGRRSLFFGSDVFPLLIPISEIPNEGLDEYWDEFEDDFLCDFDGNPDDIHGLPYQTVEWLISKHYDINDLIGQGLAISKGLK